MEEDSSINTVPEMKSSDQVYLNEDEIDEEDEFEDACATITDAVNVLEEDLNSSVQLLVPLIPIIESESAFSFSTSCDPDPTIDQPSGPDNVPITNNSETITITTSQDSQDKPTQIELEEDIVIDKSAQLIEEKSSTNIDNSRCVICTEKVAQKPIESSVEEQIVIYFIQKFLNYSLLSAIPGDSITIESLEKKRGHPSKWIWFCPICLEIVQEARVLFQQITELKSKLNQLRENVVNKVVASQDKGKAAEGISNDGLSKDEICYFTSFRQCIYELKKQTQSINSQDGEELLLLPSSLVEVKVKAECSSDGDDFGDPEEDWPGNNPFEELENVVIHPSKNNHSNPIHKHFRKETRRRPKIDYNALLGNDSAVQNQDEDFSNEIEGGERKTKSKSRASQRRRSSKNVNYNENGECSDVEFLKAENLHANMEEGDESEEALEQDSEIEIEPKPTPRKRGRPPTGKRKFLGKTKKRKNTSKSESVASGASESALSIEIRDHRGMGKCSEQSKTCPVCKRVFLNPSKMAVHFNIKHDRKILFNCEVCNRGFMRKDYLREHMKIHLSAEEKLLERTRKDCGIRKKKVKTKKGKSDVHGDQPSCQICKTAFEDTAHLQRHVNYFHGKTEGYTCEVCSKKFQWKEALRKHMRLHEGTKKFKCEEEGCESAFYYKKHLEVHQRIHTGAKDFLCAMCGISFRHEWSFNRHNIFKHHKVTSKTYLCETCGKSFKIKSHLDQHLQSKSHGGAGLKRRNRTRTKGSGGGGTQGQGSNNKQSSSQIQSEQQEVPSLILTKFSPEKSVVVGLSLQGTRNESHQEEDEEELLNHEDVDEEDSQSSSQSSIGTPNPGTKLMDTTCSNVNELQQQQQQHIAVSTSNSRENEYLRFMTMGGGGSYHQINPNNLTNLQHQQINNNASSIAQITSPSVGGGSLSGSQLNNVVLAHYQAQNYPNPFSFVTTASTNNPNVMHHHHSQQQ